MLDQGDTRVDEQTLRRVHLSPYPPTIDAGVGSVMVSYSSWNGLKCTANEYLLTDVLKGELGFEGLVISDYNAIAQTDPDFKTAIKKSINAGVDMAMEPNRLPRVHRAPDGAGRRTARCRWSESTTRCGEFCA